MEVSLSKRTIFSLFSLLSQFLADDESSLVSSFWLSCLLDNPVDSITLATALSFKDADWVNTVVDGSSLPVSSTLEGFRKPAPSRDFLKRKVFLLLAFCRCSRCLGLSISSFSVDSFFIYFLIRVIRSILHEFESLNMDWIYCGKKFKISHDRGLHSWDLNSIYYTCELVSYINPHLLL